MNNILDISISQLKTDYIRIENLNQYLLQIPQLHPSNPLYIPTWANIKKLIIEGMWGEESGGHRFCGGDLMFYANLAIIYDTDAAKNTIEIKPLIRDVEWEIFYGLLEAEGFSGFSEDDKYTSDNLILSFDKNRSPLEESWRVLRGDGKFKEYINPRENIRRLHDTQVGVALKYNQAKNYSILGSIGGGKSYTIALGKVLHKIITDGGQFYDKGKFYRKPFYIPEYEIQPMVECLVGSGDTDKSSEFCSKIAASMNALALKSEFGVWGSPGDDDYFPCPLFKDMSGSLGNGNKKNPWRHEYKVIQKGREVIKGTKSKLNHVSYSDRKEGGSQAGAGGRYAISVVEESGLTKNSIEIHNSNTSAVSRNGIQFGVQIDLGTSGNIQMIEQTKKKFTNPQDYNIVEYDDVWEGNGKNGKIGFFLPFYLTLNQFKDKDGNTNFTEAFKHVNKLREEKAVSDDPSVLREEKMNRPIVPSEMWLSDTGHYLPYEEAIAREKVLLRGNLYQKIGTPIKLRWDSKVAEGVNYSIDHQADPFYEIYFQTKLSIEGCVMIYDFPRRIGGIVPNDMYIATYDPYVSDNIDEGGSIGVTYVWLHPRYWDNNLPLTGILVASYIGKHPQGLDGYHLTQEQLLAFYGNPKQGLWYEKNRGRPCRDYYIKKNKANLLALSPAKYESDGNPNKVTQYGITIGNRIIKIQFLDLLSSFLTKEMESNLVIERIPDIFLIRQIISYKIDGNYDAVSSMLLLPVALAEIEYTMIEEVKKKNKHNPLTFLSMNKNLYGHKT